MMWDAYSLVGTRGLEDGPAVESTPPLPDVCAPGTVHGDASFVCQQMNARTSQQTTIGFVWPPTPANPMRADRSLTGIMLRLTRSHSINKMKKRCHKSRNTTPFTHLCIKTRGDLFPSSPTPHVKGLEVKGQRMIMITEDRTPYVRSSACLFRHV